MRWLPWLVLSLVPCAASARVVEDLDYHYYEVDYTPGERLGAAITRSSTVGKGKGFHGYTSWRVNWTYKWRYDDSSCWITEVTVNATGAITLPELSTSDARAQARFDTYLEALTEHELGHFAFAQNSAQEVDDGIQGMERTTCDELEADANELGEAIVAAAIAEEKQYDRDTEHGKTQGARIND